MGNGLRKAISDERWDKVRILLHEAPVRSRVHYKSYLVVESQTGHQQVKALHLVLRQRAPADVVRTMIDIDDGQALRRPARPSLELPLHYSVRYRGSARREIVRLLVENFPGATRIPSMDGNLPLHIACSKRRSIAVLRLLVGNSNDDVGEDDARTVLDPNGNSAWDIVRKKSRFWQVIYRMRARKLLKVNNAIDDDDSSGRYEEDVLDDPIVGENGGVDGFVADVQLIDGEVFHTAYEESYEITKETETTTGSSHENKHEDQKQPQGGLCVLCWDGIADRVLIPCGHICLCGRCCRQHLPSLRRKCPVCSTAFERPLKVYHAGVVAKS
jgi:hypothetical protein